MNREPLKNGRSGSSSCQDNIGPLCISSEDHGWSEMGDLEKMDLQRRTLDKLFKVRCKILPLFEELKDTNENDEDSAEEKTSKRFYKGILKRTLNEMENFKNREKGILDEDAKRRRKIERVKKDPGTSTEKNEESQKGYDFADYVHKLQANKLDERRRNSLWREILEFEGVEKTSDDEVPKFTVEENGGKIRNLNVEQESSEAESSDTSTTSESSSSYEGMSSGSSDGILSPFDTSGRPSQVLTPYEIIAMRETLFMMSDLKKSEKFEEESDYDLSDDERVGLNRKIPGINRYPCREAGCSSQDGKEVLKEDKDEEEARSRYWSNKNIKSEKEFLFRMEKFIAMKRSTRNVIL